MPYMRRPASKSPPLLPNAARIRVSRRSQSGCEGTHVQATLSGSWIASTPPGLTRRCISARSSLSRPAGANRNRTCTRSNEASGRPVAYASRSSSSTFVSSSCCTNSCAAASCSGSISTPTTRPVLPTRWLRSPRMPIAPHPRSMQLHPGARPMWSRNASDSRSQTLACRRSRSSSAAPLVNA